MGVILKSKRKSIVLENSYRKEWRRKGSKKIKSKVRNKRKIRKIKILKDERLKERK